MRSTYNNNQVSAGRKPPYTKALYLGWISCFLVIRYDLIPSLAEMLVKPLWSIGGYDVTLFWLYSALCLAIVASVAKYALQTYASLSSQTTVTTLIALGIIVLGFLSVVDIAYAVTVETDPVIIPGLIHFLQDPLNLEDLANMALNNSNLNVSQDLNVTV